MRFFCAFLKEFISRTRLVAGEQELKLERKVRNEKGMSAAYDPSAEKRRGSTEKCHTRFVDGPQAGRPPVLTNRGPRRYLIRHDDVIDCG